MKPSGGKPRRVRHAWLAAHSAGGARDRDRERPNEHDSGAVSTVIRQVKAHEVDLLSASSAPYSTTSGHFFDPDYLQLLRDRTGTHNREAYADAEHRTNNHQAPDSAEAPVGHIAPFLPGSRSRSGANLLRPALSFVEICPRRHGPGPAAAFVFGVGRFPSRYCLHLL